MMRVYFLRERSKIFSIFRKLKNNVENQSGRTIKFLRSDRGIEYNSNEFEKFCEDEGIHHQLIVGYASKQNIVVERKNETIMEMVRYMIKEKGLPNSFREKNNLHCGIPVKQMSN